ncbi:unnamed protein product [Orchesella dallaii]|uniref:Uncharacterized protein n=1 Tax=Orchesella dallaii TaxID=48710 RepID=A0ABP1QLR6_9HEXA
MLFQLDNHFSIQVSTSFILHKASNYRTTSQDNTKFTATADVLCPENRINGVTSWKAINRTCGSNKMKININTLSFQLAYVAVCGTFGSSTVLPVVISTEPF